MNPFCCREEELRKLNKRYTGDWFKCIGIRKRYGLSLLYFSKGGFTEGLREAQVRGEVRLVTLQELYQ